MLRTALRCRWMYIAIYENDSQYRKEGNCRKREKSLIFIKRKPGIPENTGLMRSVKFKELLQSFKDAGGNSVDRTETRDGTILRRCGVARFG